jgi:ribosome maturation factor RimP
MAQGHGRSGGRRTDARRGGASQDRASQDRASQDRASQDRARTAAVPARRQPDGSGPNRARLREVIEPVVAAGGYDVEGLSVSRAGRRHLVRLTVDRDGGVNLDAVADVSRLVSAALDDVEAGGEELFAGEYELQVSSPGVDRPLTLPRHWRRNVGRLVQVRAGDRQLTGRIVGADADGVVLSVGGIEHELRYGELGAGKVQLEFARAAALTDDDLEEIPVANDHDDDFEEDEA